MKIKICGITNLREVEFLNILKPDYIGLVFAESKRKVSIKTAINIIESLDNNIKVVAVFRNNSYQEVAEVLTFVKIAIVQLHGDEEIEFMNRIKEGLNLEIWRGTSIDNYLENSCCGVDKLVVDSKVPGSGVAFCWEEFNKINFSGEIFLAGGINLDNVELALQVKGISGIDISSGVEDVLENGLREKSYIKMKKVIEKVRMYDEK